MGEKWPLSTDFLSSAAPTPNVMTFPQGICLEFYTVKRKTHKFKQKSGEMPLKLGDLAIFGKIVTAKGNLFQNRETRYLCRSVNRFENVLICRLQRQVL